MYFRIVFIPVLSKHLYVRASVGEVILKSMKEIQQKQIARNMLVTLDISVGPIENQWGSQKYPGARPTKHISIEFEIRWKFKTL